MTATTSPLAEEAAKLAEAIAAWARGSLGGSGLGSAPMPESGGAPECQVCPLCQLLAVLRRAQPETFAHLAESAASLVAALRTVVDRHDHTGSYASKVERINLDDSEPWSPSATESAERVAT